MHGEQHFGRFIGVAFIEGLFRTQFVYLGPGCLAGCCIAVGLYSGVKNMPIKNTYPLKKYTHKKNIDLPIKKKSLHKIKKRPPKRKVKKRKDPKE